MPAIVKLLTERGLAAAPQRVNSLSEAARYEPREGVYTVANTFNQTQTLLLDAHLQRLEDSAARAGFSPQIERARLRAALRTMILDSGYGDVRFRISVAAATPREALLSIEPFHAPPPELIRRGARCATSSAARRQDPAAKTNDWMHTRRALTASRPPEIYETFLLDDSGAMLEGYTSNFFALRAGTVYTAAEGVLAGVARRIVLEVCAGIAPLRLRPPHIGDIERFDEAFLTSSSRGIIPVVAIDGIAIGSGVPGALTLSLRAAYQQWVGERLEEL